MTEQEINKFIKRAAKEAALEAVKSALAVAKPSFKGNCYKQTEARLYAYPTLLENIKRYKLDIEDLKREKITEKSKDITFFGGDCGIRLTPEEKQAGKILAVELKLQRDQKEIDEIDAALDLIKNDEYYPAIEMRYFKKMADEIIASQIPCAERTVRYNRSRLIRQMALSLYGAEAL
ncbi:hypothetical protein [Phascolarctobacterium sp.]